MKWMTLTVGTLAAGISLAAGVEVKDCPKCERYARYADDGRSATVNKARFEGTAAEKDAAVAAAVRRAEAMLASTALPDESKRPLIFFSARNAFMMRSPPRVSSTWLIVSLQYCWAWAD